MPPPGCGQQAAEATKQTPGYAPASARTARCNTALHWLHSPRSTAPYQLAGAKDLSPTTLWPEQKTEPNQSSTKPIIYSSAKSRVNCIQVLFPCTEKRDDRIYYDLFT